MPDKNNFRIERVRFHLQDKNKLIIIGWFPKDNPESREPEFYLDRQKLEYELALKEGVRIRQKYQVYNEDITEEVICKIDLPNNWKQYKKLYVGTVCGEKRYSVTSISVSSLKKKEQNLDYYIERQVVSDEKLQIGGWAIAMEPIEILAFSGKTPLDGLMVKRTYRRDIMEVYEEGSADYDAGFDLEVPIPKENAIRLVFRSGKKETVYRTSLNAIQHRKNGNLSIYRKFLVHLEKEGMYATLNRAARKLLHLRSIPDYVRWLKKYKITEGELQMQRQQVFTYEPRFSFVVPLYKTNTEYLRGLLDSILSQTYGKWELCLADGSGRDAALQPVVEEYQKKHPGIKYKLLEENKGISENTNAAIQMAEGEFIVLADHDDIVAPNALYECAKALNQDKNIDVLYSDEDKVDMRGRKYFEPHFKSDFNIDLLRSMNYICHLFVVKRVILKQVGMLRKEFDGAQDYDFIFRCCEAAKQVYHIPKVLYHWRCHMKSTAENPESKLYAFEAGRKAIEDHYKRCNIPAVVEHSSFYGIYHTRYQWEEMPLISIVIPNKDHIGDLQKCMDSIDQKSNYRNYEFVIVENNSMEKETFAFYQQIEQRENVMVLYYEGEFNFSRINNFGVSHAKGEYILLLNNDTEIINSDCLEEMLGYCMRDDVGIVGAKLCYEDDTIQHAGVVIGFGGMAGHAFIGASRYDMGYMGRIACAQDYSAVTAACLMTKKEVYMAVGGLSENFVVAFNDIDYCLKVRELGKLVVFNPYAELHHYESKSRGLEDTSEKIERFNGEVEMLTDKWHSLLEEGDPYYNPNLTLDKADFSLKI